MPKTASLLLSLAICGSAHAAPNVVHILADDLGWGTVGYNNPSTYVRTPNIDALAAGGMILDRGFACTVCSPSRASLLTGFHSGHASNDRNGNINDGIRAQDITTAEMLAPAGYRSAIIGKWGWGATGTRTIGATADPLPTVNNEPTLPTAQGFNDFYGYLNHSAAHDYLYSYMWQSDGAGGVATIPNNGGAGGSPQYTHDLFTRHSEAFVRDHAGTTPFYMQVSYTIPHYDLNAIDGAPALVNLRGQTIAPAGRGQFAGNASLTSIQQQYAAMIARMDASIGSLVARLDDPNGDGNPSDSILDNTLIYFTSDNGTTGEGGFTLANATDPRISGGQKGGKRDLYQGGIREPSLAYWRGRIAPGTRSSISTDLSDVPATIAELAGVQPRVGIDGVSIAPTLLNRAGQRDRGALLFENFENSTFGFASADWALIRGDQKLIKFRDGTFQLFNLAADPSEASPLSLSVPANASLKSELESIALAEGAGATDAYAVQYRDWSDGAGSDALSPGNWTVTNDPGAAVGAPDESWSASLMHAGASPRLIFASADLKTLGIEFGGTTSRLTMNVGVGRTVSGRNEVRIRDRGRVVLNNSTLLTNRWIDVQAGGELSGSGTVAGRVINAGRVSPGLPADVAAPALPPPVNTGVVPAVVFDFTGVQDQPVSATSLRNANVVVASPLHFGPGTQERANDFNDQGNELNVQGWTTTGGLAEAITNADYVSFAVAPIEGVEMKLSAARFKVWRNGAGAPPNYAILSNVSGFTSADALGTFVVADSGNASLATTLQATYAGSTWTRSSFEMRLYGWGAAGVNSHTHINAASMDASFRSVPGATIDATGLLAVHGSYEQVAGSTLAIDVGGASNSDLMDPQFDAMQVTGGVKLAGTLALSSANGFVPALSDRFIVVVGASLSGRFDAVTGQRFSATRWLVPLYSSTAVELAVALAGDCTLDGIVNFDDLLKLAASYNASAHDWTRGDFTGEGTVNFDDLLLLAANYNVQLTPTGDVGGMALARGILPEPSLIAIGSAAWIAVLRRTRLRCGLRR